MKRNRFLGRKFVCLAAVCCLSSIVISQEVMHNTVYDDNIKSIQTFVNTAASSIPVLRLNSEDLLFIQFDDLNENESKRYHYKIIHCNKDWIPSNLQEIEYVNGYADEPLRDWEFSISTTTNYIHYWVTFPNRNSSPKISGNYIIKIYDAGNLNNPVFTRRFLVSENSSLIKANFVRPINVSTSNTGHQFSLNLPVDKLNLINPINQVDIEIIQNGKWESSIKTVKPEFFTNGILSYNAFGGILFDAGNEFRFFDTRSLLSKGRSILDIDRSSSPINVYLREDQLNSYPFYSRTFDFNGNYHVATSDFSPAEGFSFNILELEKYKEANTLRNVVFLPYLGSSGSLQINEKDIRADYAKVHFTIKGDQLYRKKVYLYGALTNWKIDPAFEMIYDFKEEKYTLATLLKQGYYDYTYAVVDEKGNIDFKQDQGSFQETENDYLFLMYISGYGARYDRLVASRSLNSLTDDPSQGNR